MRSLSWIFAGLIAASLPAAARADLVAVKPSLISGGSPAITFDNPPTPVGYYDYKIVGSPFDGTDVLFGSYFAGQTPSGMGPVVLTGAPATGRALQLQIDQNDYVQIVNDGTNPNNPVLAGGPTFFSEPISIQFVAPVPAIIFDLNASGQGDIVIQAFDALGNSLGAVTETPIDTQRVGLSVSDGALIGGISIFGEAPTGFEPFSIDNFILAQNVIPAPGALCLLPAAGMLWRVRRRG